MHIKEVFFSYKMYNFEIVKAMKESFRLYVDLSLLKIYANFLGKVSWNKNIMGKKRPPIYK